MSANRQYYRLIQDSDTARDRLQVAVAEYLQCVASIRTVLHRDAPSKAAEFEAVERAARIAVAELLIGHALR
jgi:hypothetical protein